MSGWPGDMTSEQSTALGELRDRVKTAGVKEEDLADDFFMTRWLRARSYDVKQAEDMLRANVAWRKQWKVDSIYDFEVPEVLRKYYPGGYIGVDRKGCPIFWDPYGKVDPKGMLQSVKANDIRRKKIKSAQQVLDSMKNGKHCEMAGGRVHQINIVMDLESLGFKHLWQPGLTVALDVMKDFDLNQPEALKKVFIINAPRMFYIIYKLVRPILSEKTIQKIEVLGGDYYKKLLECIDADNIPVHYGGKLTDSNGDPDCSEHICWGGTVPSEYHTQPASALSAQDLSQADLGPGRALRLVYESRLPGAVLSYQFHTKEHDLAFGVFRQTDLNNKAIKNMEVILSTQRIKSHMVPEDGTIDLTEPGTYVVYFDNKYSWIHRKTLFYSISLIEPLKMGHTQSEREGAKKAARADIEESHLN